MEELNFAQDVILNKITEKQKLKNVFQDYSEYSDWAEYSDGYSDMYGDSNGGWL